MSNVETIELKGKEYKLPDSLNLNDFVEIEEKFPGQDIGKILGSMKGTRFALYHVLKKANPELKDLTEESVGDLIDLSNMDKIAEILKGMGGDTTNPPEKKTRRGRV